MGAHCPGPGLLSGGSQAELDGGADLREASKASREASKSDGSKEPRLSSQDGSAPTDEQQGSKASAGEEAAGGGEAAGGEGGELDPRFFTPEGLATPHVSVRHRSPLHARGARKAAQRQAKEDIRRLEDELHILEADKANRSMSKDPSAAKKDLRSLQHKIEVAQRRLYRFEDLADDLENVEEHIFQAARDGDLEYVKFALEVGLPVDILDERSTTLLMNAVFCNRLSVVKLLMFRRADVSLQDMNGATCIHYAVILQRHHALMEFLDAGLGSIWIKDKRGYTAIDYARNADQDKAMQLLAARLGGRPCVACVQSCHHRELQALQCMVVGCDTITHTPVKHRQVCCECCD